MTTDADTGTTLLTGGNGFLGGLVSAALLEATHRRLVLPIRTTADARACRQHLVEALREFRGHRGVALAEVLSRVTIVALPADGRVDNLDRTAVRGVDEIVNCAGCVDYFDERRLRDANIAYTGHLLRAARVLGVRRFVHTSTAFCAGYRSGMIPERLHSHPQPAEEPTAYTRSKRIAEHLVAASGIPYLIVRPSVVIGDSRTGKYTGKNYGLYQIWRAIEGLLCREYTPIWHTIAPPVPLNLVHQDAFQAAFIRGYQENSSDEIFHLVSDDSVAPTMRDLCRLWAEVYRPAEIHVYGSIDDVPLATLPRRQRRFLELGWKNFEIATQRWYFETTKMDQFRAEGLIFTDPTIETVARCQQRYIEQTPRILARMEQHRGRPEAYRVRLVERFAGSTSDVSRGQPLPAGPRTPH